MQVRLTKPEVTNFISAQVSSGKYSSPDAAVEAAVERMMQEADEPLDADTIDAINRAEEQLDRGEGVDFKTFAAQMRKKMAAG